MKNEAEQSSVRNVVFIVCSYNNIVGVYGNKQSADVVANERIMKGHPADVLCRPILLL